MPKISIVLPTFNGEKYIRDAIDSVLHQTFTDWELIVVNDCSSDGTQKIIDEYCSKDGRITCVSNSSNLKLPKSLNVGFSVARGEYLAWTSDDNVYASEALEIMNNYLDQNTNDYMVCAKMSYVSSDLKYESYSCEYDNKRLCIGNCVGACFLYRKIVQEVIGDYDDDMFLAEDYDYWLRILLKYNRIGYIDKNLYFYRNHSNSLTAIKKREIAESLLKLRKKHLLGLVEYLKNDRSVLCRLYYEIVLSTKDIKDVYDVMNLYIPEIGIDKEELLGENVIVYGAGYIGKCFGEKYKERIAYYADKNRDIVGNRLEGIEIVSLERMQNLSKDHQVVVASGIDKVYTFMVTLNKLGINSCYVCKEFWI